MKPKPTKKLVNDWIFENSIAAFFAAVFMFGCAIFNWTPMCLCYLVLFWGCTQNAHYWQQYARERKWFKI